MTEKSAEHCADKPDAWSEQIAEAHPTRTGNHATYAKALEMVGNRHSKGALVELVNWLLSEIDYRDKQIDIFTTCVDEDDHE